MSLPGLMFYKPAEVAAIFGVSQKTIYRWIDEGIIKAVRVADISIHIRYEEVERVIAERKQAETPKEMNGAFPS